MGSEDVEIIEQKGRTFHRLQFSPEELNQAAVPAEVSCLLDRVVKQWGDADLNLLLDHVYFDTEPMRDASRGACLDFSTLMPAVSQTNPKKLDDSKLGALRDKLHHRAANLHLSREPFKVSYSGRDADAAWNGPDI